jgi:hypothetical protein
MKTTILKMVKKSTAGIMLLALVMGGFGFSTQKLAHAATTWDTTGTYVINMNYQGTNYSHDMTLTQDSSGNLTGTGGSPSGANTYTWTVTSGSVTDNNIEFWANYTATADAVTPQTTVHVMGTIADDGTLSGTWSDNYAGGDRSGTISTVSGAAIASDSTSTTSKVTIIAYVDGNLATGTSANHANFQMNAHYTINGNAGTGQYALSENGYNGDPTPYQAKTSDLPNGSDYGTNSIIDGTVAASCTEGGAPFALTGYVYGDTLAQAQAATPSLTAPSFTNIQTDKYVIVLNDDCATNGVGGHVEGQVVSGSGTLQVTSVEMTDSSATANGSFEDGWKYVFNITLPSDESNLSMKFGDWSRTDGTGTIALANNMRISSPQANNSGATVTLTAANTYSTPALTMTGDLDPAVDGKQVKVTVEVKVPSGTPNGSYTTNYGVKSE